MPKIERTASDIVVSRLPRYLRTLKQLSRSRKTIISKELAEIFGYTAAQVRKDLSQFGEFGKQGKGYNIEYLIEQLESILQVDREWDMILIGFGNLGHGVLNYYNHPGIDSTFKIVAIFDIDPNLIGTSVKGVPILCMNKAEQFIRENNIKIALFAVPAEASQEVANKLVGYGIKGILTYAAQNLILPPEIRVQYIDSVSSLQNITYYL